MTEIGQKHNDLKMSFTMSLFFNEQQIKQQDQTSCACKCVCNSVTANRASFSRRYHSGAKSIIAAGSRFGSSRLGEGI